MHVAIPDTSDLLGAFDLRPDEFHQLRDLVRRHSGIALSETKMELVKRRFSPRLRALGLRSFRDYIAFVEDNFASESSHFFNAITTNLTSFYRENHHFEYLRDTVLPPLVQKARSGGRIRIWSAGCSTGQEPYCLAITLLDALHDAARRDVRILATDLDENCLNTATRGAYPTSEFTKVPRKLIDAHFGSGQIMVKSLVREAFVASEQLKALITFKKLNLMDRWPMKGPFDVIFCRNVFIYFDKPTQVKLLEGFSALQKPGGTLCLGHSETVANPGSLGYRLVGKTTYERM